MAMESPLNLFTGDAHLAQDVSSRLGARKSVNVTPAARCPPHLQARVCRVPKLHVPNIPTVATSSPAGMIQVMGYTPTEGEPGVPITVHINFHQQSLEAVYVRLVVGYKAVATKVRELANTRYGKWQLEALAPSFDKQPSASSKVLVSVQALNEDDSILDSVTFGEFSYWVPECTSPRPHKIIKTLREDDSVKDVNPAHILSTTVSSKVSDRPPIRRHSSTHLPTPSPTFSDRVSPSKTRSRKEQLHHRVKSQSLMRAKYVASGELPADIYAQTPILELVTPLESICCGWDPSELNLGRRLVRFRKLQEGRKLIVSCEPIKQEDYRDSDSVISCIYREGAEKCFVTSVDIIYLLERLTNDEFPVEEKNRIRRNLEGLRPTTVSKHKPGFEQFFQRIMEFPDPKPRNIEKDLKVFEWTLLGQALDKILSKYSIYTSCPADSTPSISPHPIEPTVMEKPPYLSTRLEYPPDNQTQPNYVNPAVVTKCEPLTDDMLISSLGTSEDYHALAPSMAFSSITPYFCDLTMFTTDLSNTQESDSSSGSWVSEPSMGDIGLGQFASSTMSFAIAEQGVPGETYTDVSPYVSSYDSLEFQTMKDDSLAISDHYL